MTTYDDMYPERGMLSEEKDCSVVALATAGRVDYFVAHAALKARGRKDRGGAYCSQVEKATRDLGLKSKLFKPRKPNGGQFTQRTIGKRLPRGHYICYVRGHFFALVNGAVKDWSEGEIKRIQRVYRITHHKGENTMYYLVDHSKMAIVAVGEDDDELFELGTANLTGDFKIMGDNITDWIDTSPYRVDELKQMCEHLTGESCNRISNVEEGAYRVLSLAASAQFKPLKKRNKAMVTITKPTKKVAKKAASKKAATKKVSPKKVAAKKVAKKPAANKPKGDGVPGEGTTTRKVWDICDKLKDKTRADVLAECEKKSINKSTASTQYQRWRAYNGL